MQPDQAASRGLTLDPRDPRLIGLVAALLVHAMLASAILLDLAAEPILPSEPDLATIPIDLIPRRPTLRERSPLAVPGVAPHTRRVTAAVPTVGDPPASGPVAASPSSEAGSSPALPQPAAAVEGRRIAEAMRRAAACRTRSDDLSPAEQVACDQRRAGRDGPARELTDPGHARFEAEGAARLAAYENLRAGLRPASPETRACPHPTDLMGRCPVQFNVPLYSSRRGFLPGLRKGDD